MGGWVTALTAAHHPELLGAIFISAVDLGLLGSIQRDTLAMFMADNMESLSGVTAQSMADDLIDGAARWRFEPAASGVARMPLLVLTAEHGCTAPTEPFLRR